MAKNIYDDMPAWARSAIYDTSKVTGISTSQLRVRDASGTVMEMSGFCTLRLRLLYDNQQSIQTVEVQVVKSLGVSMLLGQDLIGCYFQSMDYIVPDRPVLHWRQEKLEDGAYMRPPIVSTNTIPNITESVTLSTSHIAHTSSSSTVTTPPVIPVYVDKNRVVPPYAIRMVRVNWSIAGLSKSQPVVLEPVPIVDYNNDVIPLTCITAALEVGTKRSSTITIPFRNNTNQMVQLMKDQLVGELVHKTLYYGYS
jgi:hypothetical protein